jgi:hypothetical protein
VNSIKKLFAPDIYDKAMRPCGENGQFLSYKVQFRFSSTLICSWITRCSSYCRCRRASCGESWSIHRFYKWYQGIQYGKIHEIFRFLFRWKLCCRLWLMLPAVNKTCVKNCVSTFHRSCTKLYSWIQHRRSLFFLLLWPHNLTLCFSFRSSICRSTSGKYGEIQG